MASEKHKLNRRECTAPPPPRRGEALPTRQRRGRRGRGAAAGVAGPDGHAAGGRAARSGPHRPAWPSLSPPAPSSLRPAGWTYWELRTEWKTAGNKKQDWKELPTPLFDVDTVEDFWVCYNRCPKIV